jgi:hypothetical protein
VSQCNHWECEKEVLQTEIERQRLTIYEMTHKLMHERDRCAQVALEVGNKWSNDTKAISEIAAAIRTLKDE